MHKHRRVQLVVPEIATVGGIQSYMQRLWEMLNELPDTEIKCVSLNDSSLALERRIPDSIGRLRGHGRRKIPFVLKQLLSPKTNGVAIIGHLHHAPIGMLAKVLGRIEDYIVILHGIEAWKRHNWIIRWAMRMAWCNVATTHYTANHSARLNGISPSQYRIIPLCAERKAQPISEPFKLNGEFPLLMVARLDANEKYKGVETVIDAVVKLRKAKIPAHFNVIGDGGDRPRLERYAQEKACGEYTTFWGRLSDAEVHAAYLSAAVFVMPSKSEGFGIVYVEAMRHRVPCIGGNHGGTPEVIRAGETGFLVEYGDVETLVSQISLLASDADRYRKMRDASGKDYAERFTFAVFCTHWKRLLQSNDREGHSSQKFGSE